MLGRLGRLIGVAGGLCGWLMVMVLVYLTESREQ